MAELRVLRNQVHVGSSDVPKTATPTAKETVSAQRLSALVQTTSQTSAAILDYQHVKNDLKKVAVLATIALLLEIVLSLTLNSGFVNLLKDLIR